MRKSEKEILWAEPGNQKECLWAGVFMIIRGTRSMANSCEFRGGVFWQASGAGTGIAPEAVPSKGQDRKKR